MDQYLSILTGEIGAELRAGAVEPRQAVPWLQAIFGQAAVGIVLADREGRVLHANRRMCQITGRSPQELTRLASADITHPDDWALSQKLIAEVANGQRAEFTVEKRYVRPDGSHVWASVTVSPLREGAGRPERLIAVVQDITTRKAAEHALRESERRFRRVLERLPAAAYLCDRDGMITYFNHQAEVLWGRAPKLNDPVDRFCGSFKLFLSDGTPITHDRCWMARALEDETAYDAEEIIIERPDGNRLIVLAHASPLWDENDRLLGAVNVLVNVTQLKETENSLRKSEDRFARFMQHLPGLAWIKDEAGKYLFANEAAQRAFGRTPAELYGNTDESLFPESSTGQLRENDLKALHGGTGIEAIEALVHQDGVHHSLVSKFPIPGINDAPNLLGGMAIDITAYKQAELALRESESRFRSLADTAPVLIWVNGVDGCEFVNREYLTFVGGGLEDVRGSNWQRSIHPDDVQDYVVRYAEAVAARQPFDAQSRFKRAGGDYRWLKSTGVPRFAADGSFLGYVGCSVDITDLKRSEEALRDADQRKDEFLATLAHELRNPLAPIRSSLEILRLAGGDSSTGQLHDMLERQVTQMVRLVDDLLEVSRITRGKIELRRERVELRSVLGAALETSKPLIDAARHRLDIALPPERLWLDADAVRLAQVFSNLLNNAAKYTEADGRIWLTASEDNGRVVVSVRDTGVGIAPEMLPRVFNLFAQGDGVLSRAQGGLGIGLALARRLVQMHGGRIDVRSAGSGRGSEFRVSLPLAGEPKPADTLTDAPAESLALPRPSLRVLVVDDNRDAADSLGMLLRLRGMDAQVVHDGPAALRALPEFRPTVVLLDLGMPDMDGYEVAQHIREDHGFDDVILVALTGWGHDEFRRRSREIGFDHHLVKPVDVEALLSLLAPKDHLESAH